MKLHLATRTLYDDDGVFLKPLYCPLQKSWDQLHPDGGGRQRNCSDCARVVHDTADMTDVEVRALLNQDPAACLRITAGQGNLTLVASVPSSEAGPTGPGSDPRTAGSLR